MKYIHDALGRLPAVQTSIEHTLYFKDENSAVAQWTRTDAVLPNIDLSAAPIPPSPLLTRIEENYNDLAYRVDSVLTQSPHSRQTAPICFYY